MKATRIIVSVAAAICFVNAAGFQNSCAYAANPMVDKSMGRSISLVLEKQNAPTLIIIRGGELPSQMELSGKKWGALGYVAKTWDERFDGRSRFDIRFYGRFNAPSAGRDYLQNIAMTEGGKEVYIHDWDTADCSLEKAELIGTPEGSVFVVIASRSPNMLERQITPQYERTPQIVRIFLLRQNSGEIPGFTRAYFDKVYETNDEKGVCTDSEVYDVMESEFKRFYKQ
jgi:hypothetical protein